MKWNNSNNMGLEEVDLVLDDDQQVVAHYLVKLLGLNPFDTIDKHELFDITRLYLVTLYRELYIGPEEEPYIQASISDDKIMKIFQERSDRQTNSVPECKRTPVVCFRCKLPGHIARGCTQFRCFRCKELGHTIRGCRKRRRGPVGPGRHSSDSCSSPCDMGTLSKVQQEECYVESAQSHVESAQSHVEAGQSHIEPAQSHVEAVESGRLRNEEVEDVSVTSAVESESSGFVTSGVRDSDVLEVCEQEDEQASDCASDGLELKLDSAVSEEGDLCEVEDTGSGDDLDEFELDSGAREGDFVLSTFSADDQDRPCWTYLSEDAGVDCTDMALHDFFEYLKSDANQLDEEAISDILDVIKEEQSDIEKGFPNRFWYMYQ